MKALRIMLIMLGSILAFTVTSCKDDDKIIWGGFDTRHTCKFYVDFVKDGKSLIYNTPTIFNNNGSMEIVTPYTYNVAIDGGTLKDKSINGELVNGKCYFLCSASLMAQEEGEGFMRNGMIKTEFNIPLFNREETDVITINWEIDIRSWSQYPPAYPEVKVNGVKIDNIATEPHSGRMILTIEVE